MLSLLAGLALVLPSEVFGSSLLFSTRAVVQLGHLIVGPFRAAGVPVLTLLLNTTIEATVPTDSELISNSIFDGTRLVLHDRHEREISMDVVLPGMFAGGEHDATDPLWLSVNAKPGTQPSFGVVKTADDVELRSVDSFRLLINGLSSEVKRDAKVATGYGIKNVRHVPDDGTTTTVSDKEGKMGPSGLMPIVHALAPGSFTYAIVVDSRLHLAAPTDEGRLPSLPEMKKVVAGLTGDGRCKQSVVLWRRLGLRITLSGAAHYIREAQRKARDMDASTVGLTACPVHYACDARPESRVTVAK